MDDGVIDKKEAKAIKVADARQQVRLFVLFLQSF